MVPIVKPRGRLRTPPIGRAVVVISALMLAGCSTGGPGEAATWTTLNGEALTPTSTHVELGVTRLGCASGRTGTVLDPVVRFEAARVIITASVAPLPQGVGYNCQGNDSVSVSVDLDEPVGQRSLVDGTCLGGEAANTAVCVDDAGVRWKPTRD